MSPIHENVSLKIGYREVVKLLTKVHTLNFIKQPLNYIYGQLSFSDTTVTKFCIKFPLGSKNSLKIIPGRPIEIITLKKAV